MICCKTIFILSNFQRHCFVYFGPPCDWNEGARVSVASLYICFSFRPIPNSKQLIPGVPGKAVSYLHRIFCVLQAGCVSSTSYSLAPLLAPLCPHDALECFGCLTPAPAASCVFVLIPKAALFSYNFFSFRFSHGKKDLFPLGSALWPTLHACPEGSFRP